VGECVAKPPPTGDRTHHLQHIEWESYVASLEIGKPSHSFSLVASPLFTLVEGSQRTGGALANHELSNKKFANKH